MYLGGQGLPFLGAPVFLGNRYPIKDIRLSQGQLVHQMDPVLAALDGAVYWVIPGVADDLEADQTAGVLGESAEAGDYLGLLTFR
jgi:hypothetical protein